MKNYKKAKTTEDEKFKYKFSQESWVQKNDYINIDLIQDHLPSLQFNLVC